MAKLKLVASPTFKAKVPIPVAGGADVDVEMTFKHRTRKELQDFINSRENRKDIDSFLEMVEGWELEDEFTRENAELLLENYMGAGLATYQKYITELVKAKAGN